MEIGGTALAFYGLGAGVVVASLVALKRRLQLSKAKHRSLNGHARIARRIASLVPFYEYDEGRFFRSDNAPAKIAALRRGRRHHFRPSVHSGLPGAVPVQPLGAPASQDRRLRAIV